MDTDFTKIYSNLLNSYKRTGKIGNVKPYNADHAQRIAWTVAQKLINKNKINKNKSNTISSPSRQGAEPLTGCQTYCQLNLFSNK